MIQKFQYKYQRNTFRDTLKYRNSFYAFFFLIWHKNVGKTQVDVQELCLKKDIVWQNFDWNQIKEKVNKL